MNIITASLCKKPVIGVVIWLMTLCATNQALQDKFIDLNNVGVLVHEMAYAPMNEQYRLVLLLTPNTNSDTGAQEWQQMLCTNSTQILSVTLRIKDANGIIESEQTTEATCPRPNYEDTRALLLDVTQVKKGKFEIELVNNNSLSQFKDQKIQVLMMGQSSGYP